MSTDKSVSLARLPVPVYPPPKKLGLGGLGENWKCGWIGSREQTFVLVD